MSPYDEIPSPETATALGIRRADDARNGARRAAAASALPPVWLARGARWLWRAWLRSRERKAAREELLRMDDRQLRDIGITRTEIEHVFTPRRGIALRATSSGGVPLRSGPTLGRAAPLWGQRKVRHAGTEQAACC